MSWFGEGPSITLNPNHQPKQLSDGKGLPDILIVFSTNYVLSTTG